MIPAIAGLTAPARTATPAAKESGAQGFEARLNSAPEASKPGASAKPAEAVAPKADARDSAGTEAEAPVDPGAVPAEDAAEHSTDASARAEAETAAASA